MSLAKLRREAGINSLLSEPNSNPKIKKNQKVGVLGTILHLSPATISGQEFCPGRSPGCTSACLNTAGNPAYAKAKANGRLRRSRLLIERPKLFRDILMLEIAAHVRAAERANMVPSVRLNGTSDLPWYRRFPEIFSEFPGVDFVDYTKVLPISAQMPPNYHLTFSLSENNLDKAVEAARRGFNVAVVFEKVPEFYTLGSKTFPVFPGDDSDYRPLDPKGVIVGLKAKGLARKDYSGFVIRPQVPLSLAA
jgi:hypothetical protein